MRPAKPIGLVKRENDRADRTEAERALRPERALPLQAPARLKGHDIAAETWRRIMRTYSGIEAEVVTRLDMDLLIDYCILAEQVTELDRMRKTAYRLWLELAEAHDRIDGKVQKALQDEEKDLAEQLQDEMVQIAVRVVGAFDAVVKLDSRVDRKRDLLFKLRQSLYLTPRARAGTAPKRKDAEQPKDELEMLLDDVTDFVNGDRG